MKKKLILLTCLFSCSIFAILVLYGLSNKNSRTHSSFVRFIPSHVLDPIHEQDIKYNSYYIAGITASKIYLGNVTAPLHLLTMNSILTDSQHIKIKNNDSSYLKATQITIDSPNFYLADLSSHSILRGTLETLQANRYMYDSAFFAEAIPISQSTFAIRTWRDDVREFILARETSYPPYTQQASGLLEKQIDGIFCTDGMLNYNRDMNWLIYVYYYRNQFICMDTSLNLIYRGKTIDTISHAQVKVAKINSEKVITQAAPPLLVNRKSCVAEDWLFINSGLPAKNDDMEMFNNGSVIDVYYLRNGKYKFSFYLPNYRGHKMKEFKVYKNKIIVTYAHYLVAYQIDHKYFL